MTDDLNAEWRRWLLRFNRVMRNGAELTARTRSADQLDVHGLIGQLIYAQLEIRRIELARELTKRTSESQIGGE